MTKKPTAPKAPRKPSRAPKAPSYAKAQEERTLPPLKPLTEAQADYLVALSTSQQIVVLGPAGTGKTFLAATWAADALRGNRVSRVVLTRPNVPGGRSLGFFPGTLEEKVAPWVVPFISVMEARMGKAAYEIALKRGEIEIVPFEVMRGRSWDDAIVILDEAQNTTPEELKMFLTRIGQDTQVILNGDLMQSDLDIDSGLSVAIDMIDRYGIPAEVVEFTLDDIVRSDICAQWARAFYEEETR